MKVGNMHRLDDGQWGVVSASLRWVERDLRSALAVLRAVVARGDSFEGVAVFRSPVDNCDYEVNAGLVASGWVADEIERFESILDDVQDVAEVVLEVAQS
jgi:hypothetical protein